MFILPVLLYLLASCYTRSLHERKRNSGDVTQPSASHLNDASIKKAIKPKEHSLFLSRTTNSESKVRKKCSTSNKRTNGCPRSHVCYGCCDSDGDGEAENNCGCADNEEYGSDNNGLVERCDFGQQMWDEKCACNYYGCKNCDKKYGSCENKNDNNDGCTCANKYNCGVCAFTNGNSEQNNNNDRCGCDRDCCEGCCGCDRAGCEVNAQYGSDNNNNIGCNDACAYGNCNNNYCACSCENNNINCGACSCENNNINCGACSSENNNINCGACAFTNFNSNGNKNNVCCDCGRDRCNVKEENDDPTLENDCSTDAACCVRCPGGISVNLCRCYKHIEGSEPNTKNGHVEDDQPNPVNSKSTSNFKEVSSLRH